MKKINDILTLDLQDDIKSVIDVEDSSELEIQQEIENYIITKGISEYLYSFTNKFTSNVKETGVWLSRFYGSGKSYFGKMLGYIIANPVINGTPARERFIPRLKGVPDESLVENSIRRLESINSRVVFLDVAKQNTEQGLAFTLFSNLLKSLSYREDMYGYMEFELFIDGKLDEFKSIVHKLEGQDWDTLKKSNRQVAKVMRRVYSEMGYSDIEYNETIDVYKNAIDNFSTAKFKSELEKYLNLNPDETLVFIFDEASEAISQKKFTLLDLEGISEALSSISQKVWTIAIAQEKLDDVINNANVNRSQLSKVTDRFKTKIHLESTEVDVIIRSRLLKKKDESHAQLTEYYNKNEGLVSDATNLKSSFPTKTTSADDFAIYYPFHRYQFDILQKFLFSSNALVATQIAARGMIITTFDVLRKQMKDKELYSFTPGFAICTEAQTAPPVGLVSKYDTAKKVINEKYMPVDGAKLLKTIHLLADSEVVAPTVENITKSYITDLKTYYDLKPIINDALNLLVDAKVLLLSNNSYKITSDLEGKLLEEMNDLDVELYNKKRSLIKYIKEYKIFSPVSTYISGSDSFKFSIRSDQDDDLSNPGNDQLNIKAYSLFNISEDRQDFVERIKLETQHHKDLITMIPDSKAFQQIDKLIGEISRYTYMKEKYANDSDLDKRQIIRDFSLIREEKEKELRSKIEDAYHQASIVYMFDETLLNADTFKGSINEVQKRLIKNVYTKRLKTQLSEKLAPKIFSSRKEDLHNLFSGDDFKFFDRNGNFTGDHLKVVEEINAQSKNRYIDGRTLEAELSGAPWAYSFGTIVSTLAVMFRAGKLSVKFSGMDPIFSYREKPSHDAFLNATRFKSASFKSITATLTSSQKKQAVQSLLDLDIETHTGRKISWSSSDFDVADSIKHLAEHFISAMGILGDTIKDFNLLFPRVASLKALLQEFTAKVTENNYIEKVEHFLTSEEQYKSSIQKIIAAQKFIKKSFPQARIYKNFIDDVLSELVKADRTDELISTAHVAFNKYYRQDMVHNFAELQNQVQIVKDGYYKLIKNAAGRMSGEYQILSGKVTAALQDLKKNYPAELNEKNQIKLSSLERYCNDRIVDDPVLEFSITCKKCGYSLSDILNYAELAKTKDTELLIIQSSLIKNAPGKPGPKGGGSPDPSAPKSARKIIFHVPGKKMTVQEYRSLLTAQLSALAAAPADEEIELDIQSLDQDKSK